MSTQRRKQQRKMPPTSQSKQKSGSTPSPPSTPSPSRPGPVQDAATAAVQGSNSAVNILFIFPLLFVLACLSITTWLYQRALDPLYGGVPTQLHLSKVIWAASILGALGPVPSVWTSLAITGCLLFSLPNFAYWVSLWTARWHDPVFGPVVTHLLVLFPVAYSGISIINRIARYLEDQSAQKIMLRFTILPACGTSILGLQSIWSELPILSSGIFTDNDIVSNCLTDILGTTSPGKPSESLLTATRYGWSCFAIWAVSIPFRVTNGVQDAKQTAKSYGWRLLLPGIIIPFLPFMLPYLHPPTLPHPLPVPFVHPNFPLRVLSSTLSVTGMIVVGEILPPSGWEPGMAEDFPHSLRYLRASHSLLGGVWMGGKIASRTKFGAPLLDEQGSHLGDSIYSAFVLQEAIKLVEKEGRDIKDGAENALIIGLGAGITATAFAHQKIATTIVEIDPAVYNASRQYFGLPDPGPEKMFLEDARRFVAQRRRQVQLNNAQGERFDFVIHDCFSGGSVPAHLFTVQFWEDLKMIMNPEGVLAVNFAGKLNSNPSKAILTTLQSSFGVCRAFHDAEAMSEEELLSGFVNMVFFCSPSSKPLTFRSPREGDYLNSHLRAHVFETLPQREVNLQLISKNIEVKDAEKWILKDENNQLQKWQEEGALEHWQIMRQILPATLWETF